MADVSIQEAKEALDVARFIGDVRRIAAAKAILAQCVAARQTPLDEPDHPQECHQKLAAD